MEAQRYKVVGNKPSITRNLTRPVRDYFGAIPLSGAALTSGAAYWAGLSLEVLHDLITNAPYLIQQQSYESIYKTLYTAIQQGIDQGGNWALCGGLVGLILTNKFKNTIASFIKK